ncbi:MAG: hypothetical protein WBH50_16645, partial [Fuerstiella sp.]
ESTDILAMGKVLDCQPMKELKSSDACPWQSSGAKSMQPRRRVGFVSDAAEPIKKGLRQN